MKLIYCLRNLIPDLFHYLIYEREKLTLENIKAVYQGYMRLLTIDSQPRHIREQFYWRLFKRDEGCKEAGKCPCNCKAPFKQLDDRACDKNCYIVMIDEKSWDLYKTLSNITAENLENYRKEAKSSFKKYLG